MLTLVAMVSSMALSVLCPTLPRYAISSISVVAAFIACTCYSRFCEHRADESAHKNCSELAKAGAIAMFNELINSNLKLRNENGAIINKIFIDLHGNDLLDIFHPSLTSRIDYLSAL